MTEAVAATTTTPNPDGGNAATDGQTDGAATGAPTEGTKAPTEPAVPEAYDLKMPEGVELDKAAAEEFTALAKELKLDQTNAQKFADLGAKMAQRQAEAHANLVESWTEASKTDKEFGGEKFSENLATAQKAMATFGSPQLKALMDSTGMGNHPDVIRAFYNVGKAISEGRFVNGGAPSGETDPALKMFPSMQPKG